jgi:hypothetical protein
VQKRRDFSFASARRRRALPSSSYRSTAVPLSQLRRPLFCFFALRRGTFTDQEGSMSTLLQESDMAENGWQDLHRFTH